MTDTDDWPEPTATPRAGPGLIFFTAIASLGLGLFAFILYYSVWTAEQFALADGAAWSPFAWPLVVAMHGAVVAVPAYILSRSRWPARYQAIFKTWTLSGIFVFFTIPQHLVGPTDALSGAALQIGSTVAFITSYAVWLRRDPASLPAGQEPGPDWLLWLVVPLIIWPWFIWGALGSGLDTILNLAAALLLGLATALIARRYLLLALDEDGASPVSRIGLGGHALGGTLVTVGAAFGVNGQQLILLFLLPSLAWLAIGLAERCAGCSLADRWLSIGLLVGLVAAAPLIFVDPDELLLILNAGTRDVGAWARNATAVSVTIALFLGLVVLLTHRIRPSHARYSTPIAAGAAWAGIVGLLLIVGQPGWYGDRLFVMIADQPVLPAKGDADYWMYRERVYQEMVAHADTSQAELRASLGRWGLSYTPYYLVNALEVDGGPFVRLWLAQRTDVDRVLDSPELRPLPAPAPVNTGMLPAPQDPSWNLTMIGAPTVWDELGIDGGSIVIGQSDSGAEGTHPELARQYRGAQSAAAPGDTYNWLDPWNNSPSPVDTGGHGTHTLGTVVGEKVGVAPGAQWIACVNLDRNLGNPARYLDCLQFLFAPYPQGGDAFTDGRPELGAHILNNSWSCPSLEGCDPTSLRPAIEALRQAGVFFVASAGNSGSECGTVDAPPALHDAAFSVGAIDATGALATFSSRGPVTIDGSDRVKPDLVAPGVDVISAFPGGTYRTLDGTSMASPHVAGVVALLWAANPALIGDIARTETILTDTAQPYDQATHGIPACGSASERPDNATGYGIVDALAAVQAALALR